MDHTTHEQLLLATRIHHALMRYLGSGVDVGRMVGSDDYAREVLYVCEGCGDAELKALGEQFKRVRGPFAPVRRRGRGVEPSHDFAPVCVRGHRVDVLDARTYWD